MGQLFLFTLSSFLSTTIHATAPQGLLQKLQQQGPQDVVLEFPSIIQTVLENPLIKTMGGDLKVDMMVSLLQQVTQSAQKPFILALKQIGVADKDIAPFWISNKIGLRSVSGFTLEQFLKVPFQTSFTIREPHLVRIPPNTTAQAQFVNGPSINATSQWGVQKIGAPAVWMKSKGAGILVANIDTGVNGEHEALKSNYAGKFFDAFKGKTVPYDTDGHGTHTMGIMVGQTRGIGVAPAAKWIACKGLEDGAGTDVSLTTCAQWVLQQKPRVVSNSWGSDVGGQTWFNDEIKVWRAAGIIPVFSIGNNGASGKCKTAGSPGDQPNVISVGATSPDNSITEFSSRGPNDKGIIKPEVSAPGFNIISAGIKGTNSYVSMSGTSMSAPNVGGAIALLLSLKPSMKYEEVKTALETTAHHPNVPESVLYCGKSPNGGNYPNNAFGSGIIFVKRAAGL